MLYGVTSLLLLYPPFYALHPTWLGFAFVVPCVGLACLCSCLSYLFIPPVMMCA